jgi:tetratricopeptide (TPR) repeat protein
MMLFLIPGMLLGESAELAQARNFYRHTDYPAAIRLLANVSVKDASVNELLGQCYLMSGDSKSATEYLETAVSAEPGNSVYTMWLGRAYGHRAETSFALGAMGWANKARAAWEKAVQLDPHNWEAVDDLFEFYFQAPSIVGGGLDRAEKLAGVIARRDPAEAAYDRARIAEARKDYGGAEKYFKQSTELAPHEPGKYVALAKFCARHGRYEESDKFFDEAKRVAPDAARVDFAQASTYIQSKRNVDTARVLLKKYLSASNLTPDDPPKSEAQKLLRKVSGS